MSLFFVLAAVPVAAQNLDELYDQLNAQERTIRALTNRVEELTFQQEQLSAQVRRLSADVDVRFNTLPAAVALPEAPPKAPKTPPLPPSKQDQKDFDAAYAFVKAGNHVKAEQAFRKFLTDHPASSLAGNANYWLGKTYFARGLYAEALGIFGEGVDKYKTNAKAPDSLLHIGLSFAQMGQKEDACFAFAALPQEFPKASAELKKQAVDEAKKAGCP